MSFKSLEFLIFFPLTTALYFLLPHRFRWGLLLAASCFFYLFFVPAYILILFAMIAVDYFAAIVMENLAGRKRTACLAVSLAMTLGILFAFKYFNFFNDNIGAAARFLGWNYGIGSLKLLLPLGLSFHTFQSMSYVIEVYRRNQNPERNFGLYALYVMFYPQLVAGPIERPQHLLPQFSERHYFEYERAVGGLRRMVWGFFKKIVIADRLALFVTGVYNAPADVPSVILVLATVFFAVQVYCDFSGYADIALGAAQVMGFRLRENFMKPFSAQGVAEFWRRWHISLTSWLHDYLYVPLALHRRRWGTWGIISAVMLTWTLIGFWHGANWTYVVFGLLHGAAVSGEVLAAKLVKKVRTTVSSALCVPAGILVTFGFFCFTLVFFRAPDIRTAWYVLSRLAGALERAVGLLLRGDLAALQPLAVPPENSLFTLPGIAAAALITVLMIASHAGKSDTRATLESWPAWARWTGYAALVLGIFLFGSFESSGFIYFQF